MNKLGIKLGTAAAIATLITTVIAPATLADTTVHVNGNGSFSFNSVNVTNHSHKSVHQSNSTLVGTGVNVTSNTGGNNSSFNTGGSNTINTGVSVTSVGVSVEGGSNTAVDPLCGCQNTNTTVHVNNNGDNSFNAVSVSNSQSSHVSQSNETIVETDVHVDSNTGNNTSSFNTNGSSTVTTGGSSTGVSVNVTGSSNTQL